MDLTDNPLLQLEPGELARMLHFNAFMHEFSKTHNTLDGVLEAYEQRLKEEACSS